MRILKRTITVAICVLAVMNACSSSSSEPGPDGGDLSSKEQKMIGTWKLIRNEGDDIFAGPPEGTYTWTFNSNHRATYLQKPAGSDGNTREVNWRLDGDEIVFDNDTTYRVEQYGKTQMKWYNYKMAELGHSHTYVVEKQ